MKRSKQPRPIRVCTDTDLKRVVGGTEPVMHEQAMAAIRQIKA